MSVLSAQTIRRLCHSARPLLQPFHERTVHAGMTFGLDSAGYDIRIAETRIMWPGRFTKVDAIETFDIPDWLKLFIADKSTWARRGIVVQNTRGEPGWRGHLRLEITNHSWWFMMLRRGMPIAQAEFHMLDEPTTQPYPENGKYQNQRRNQNAVYQDQDAGPQPALFGDELRRKQRQWRKAHGLVVDA